METAKHSSPVDTSNITYGITGVVTSGMTRDITYGGTPAVVCGLMHHSSMDVVWCSQQGMGTYGGLFPQPGQIIPVFMTQDRSAWRLEELVSGLRELLSKITMEGGGEYVGLPDSFAMPPVPAKAATLRIVRKEPTEFRFIED